MNRRAFLSATGTGLVLAGCAGAMHGAKSEEGEEVTPAEDLMREHGVLRRVMYIYDEAIARLDGQRDVPLDALAAGAGIIRRVIEDYHEKIEEQMLFPRFEKAGKLADLTAILRRQHQTGRLITDHVMTLAKSPLPDTNRKELADALRSFNHMYRPHAAREDTVLFPEIRKLVGASAYKELGEQFEDKEKEMIGEGGFERAVADVARLEQAFGIDLAAL